MWTLQASNTCGKRSIGRAQYCSECCYKVTMSKFCAIIVWDKSPNHEKMSVRPELHGEVDWNVTPVTCCFVWCANEQKCTLFIMILPYVAVAGGEKGCGRSYWRWYYIPIWYSRWWTNSAMEGTKHASAAGTRTHEPSLEIHSQPPNLWSPNWYVLSPYFLLWK